MKKVKVNTYAAKYLKAAMKRLKLKGQSYVGNKKGTKTKAR